MMWILFKKFSQMHFFGGKMRGFFESESFIQAPHAVVVKLVDTLS